MKTEYIELAAIDEYGPQLRWVGGHWADYAIGTKFFATLARADLEATIADQAEEIDRLKSTPPDQRQDLHCVVSDISAECRELRQQLAAEQAYAEQLREALQRLTQFNSSEEYVQVRTEHVSYGRSALSIPHDSTALQEYGAKLVERIADNTPAHVRRELGDITDKIRKGEF